LKYKDFFVYDKVPVEIPNYQELIDSKLEKDFSPLEPSEVFLPHNFAKMHDWVKECSFKIITTEIDKDKLFTPIADYVEVVDKDLDKFKSYIKEKAVTYDGFNKPVIALDLETSGLSTKGKLIKGRFVPDTEIVSVPLAISDKEGFILPVKHTETDGIKNLDWETQVKPFLQWLIDNFHIVLHNAQFDLAHLSNWGIKIGNIPITDTMLVSKLMNNQEFMPMNIGHGLKALSEYVLNRKMLEINEILNLPTKNHISFNRLPVSNALTYAGSDATNTYGLFKAFVIDDIYGRNPYKEQPTTTKIVHQALYYVISSLQYGLLIDKDRLVRTIKTINIRMILLEQKFINTLKKYGYEEEISVVSPMVSVIIVNYILKPLWKGDENNFYKYIEDYFGLVRKVDKLKSGAIKEQFNMDDSILSKFKSAVMEAEFLPEDTKQDIQTLLSIISLYRSLVKDIAIYYGILYNLYIDDRNHFFVNINLRYIGTDTLRFANEKGSGHPRYATFNKLKTKTNCKLKLGNGITHSLNTQGMPSESPKLVKLKKVVTKLPQMEELEREAEQRIINTLISWEYKSKN